MPTWQADYFDKARDHAPTRTVRWIWGKSDQQSPNRLEKLQQSLKRLLLRREGLHKLADKNNVTIRWNALLRYDDEIRTAAEKLRPFGDSRVNELAEAFFALNEDKRYLPNIVSRITEEAKQDKARQWAKRFRYTFDGEPYTQESLNILRAAETQGYVLSVANDKTIAATKNNVTLFVRPNGDIQRFGQNRGFI